MDNTREATTAPNTDPALEEAALLVFETDERTLRMTLESELRLMVVAVTVPVMVWVVDKVALLVLVKLELEVELTDEDVVAKTPENATRATIKMAKKILEFIMIPFDCLIDLLCPCLL